MKGGRNRECTLTIHGKKVSKGEEGSLQPGLLHNLFFRNLIVQIFQKKKKKKEMYIQKKCFWLTMIMKIYEN